MGISQVVIPRSSNHLDMVILVTWGVRGAHRKLLASAEPWPSCSGNGYPGWLRPSSQVRGPGCPESLMDLGSVLQINELSREFEMNSPSSSFIRKARGQGEEGTNSARGTAAAGLLLVGVACPTSTLAAHRHCLYTDGRIQTYRMPEASQAESEQL